MNDPHDPRSLLESAYQKSVALRQNALSFLSETQQQWIKTIAENAESQKAVLAVLVTSLVKKIGTPT